MICFSIPGEPAPKERARAGKGRWFTPKQTVDAEKNVRDYAELAARSAKGYPRSGHFWIGATFYMGCTRSKRGHLLQRNADLDNLLKLVQDGMKNVFWFDDKQVRGYLPGTKKVLGARHPQTVVALIHEDELSAEQAERWGSLPRAAIDAAERE